MVRRRRLFFAFSLFFTAVSFALIWKTDGEAVKPFFYYYTDYCADFYNQLLYVRDPQHVYQASPFSSFPPFAYLIYYALGKFIPASVVEGTGAWELRDNLCGFTLYVVCSAVLSVLLACQIQAYLEKERPWQRLLATLLILLSAPFLGLFERGNSVFLVLILLLAGVRWMDHPDRRLREAALLAFAAAAAMKFYPAVFGLLYLRQRRWGEAARLTAYGLFLVFAPFVFFGGKEGFLTLLSNLRFITEGYVLGGDLRSVAYAVTLFGGWLGGEEQAMFLLGEKLSLLYFAVCCAGVVLQPVLWKQLILLAGIMILFPAWSGSYTLIYLALPLLLFLAEEKAEEKNARRFTAGYEILFGCVFTLVLLNPSWSQTVLNSDFPYTVRILGTWGLVGLTLFDTAVSAWPGRARRKEAARS